MHVMHVDSVQHWMKDLRLMAECECMCILQSKPISTDGDGQSELVVAPQRILEDKLQALLKRAWIITTELSKIFHKLEQNRWQRIHSTAVRVGCHVRSLINEYNSYTGKLELNLCAFLCRCVGVEDPETLKPMKGVIVGALMSLSQSFSQMVELALTHEIQVSEEMQVRNASGKEQCIDREGGVMVLFKLCRQESLSYLHPHALRALSSLCGVEEGINQLEKVDGVLCLADLLTDETNSEATRAEAAAVVAQITSPHLSFTQHLSSFLENMEDMVTALINMCKDASSSEVFLLASAALANITFFDSMACEMLLQLNATKILIDACRDPERVDTPYCKDQVVTILANMATLDQCASEISQENGVELLLELLHEKSSPGVPAEAGALERVLQKAAVTLARLSRDPSIIRIATKQNCIPRLIELCRSPSERNNSDSVLVACLAALRKLSASCPESFEDSDYQQLIKPRLVDSFLLCSNMEESFV
uniref:INSC spindle orientation adaptor protein n=1 Tax=Callorhinchus milii TaxID=7868 RepID=A0A4W3JPE5_CALMI